MAFKIFCVEAVEIRGPALGFVGILIVLILRCICLQRPVVVVWIRRRGEPIICSACIGRYRGTLRRLLGLALDYGNGGFLGKEKLTSPQHFAKYHHACSGSSSPIKDGCAVNASPVSFSITCTLVLTSLISSGDAQCEGSSGSVLHISVTFAIMSLPPSSLQNETQTSCMQYPDHKA